MPDAPREPSPAPRAKTGEKSGPQRAMEKLGLRRDIDLALHLPLRYEDETRVSAIADAPDGEPVQVEGIVRECRIELRGRRQLLVRIEDDSDDLLLRFLNFYPSHQKTLAVGARVRVRGEAHAGFFGREMVHPQFKAVDENSPLATALTPEPSSSTTRREKPLPKEKPLPLRSAGSATLHSRVSETATALALWASRKLQHASLRGDTAAAAALPAPPGPSAGISASARTAAAASSWG